MFNMNIKKLLIGSVLCISVLFNFAACSSNTGTPDQSNASVDGKTQKLKDDIKQEAGDMKDNVDNSMDNMMGNSSANTQNK